MLFGKTEDEKKDQFLFSNNFEQDKYSTALDVNYCYNTIVAKEKNTSNQTKKTPNK